MRELFKNVAREMIRELCFPKITVKIQNYMPIAYGTIEEAYRAIESDSWEPLRELNNNLFVSCMFWDTNEI